MKSLNRALFLALLLVANSVCGQDLKRYDPYADPSAALRLTLGDPRVGFTFPTSNQVARVGKSDYWLIGGSSSTSLQAISMVKLDRKLGECSTQQILEGGGVWSYSNNFNLLFAGRPNTDGSNTNIHSEPGSGLTYSCFDLKSNAHLWTFPKELPVLSTAFSADQKSIIVLAGEAPTDRVQYLGGVTLYWLDARTGTELKKVELPGESNYTPYYYYDGSLVDTAKTTYVFRKSEKEPQIYAVSHQSETPEALDEKLGFEPGQDLEWKMRVQPVEEKWMTFHHRQRIHLFALEDGRFIEKKTVEGGSSRFSYDDCENVRFDPEGKRLIAGSERHTLIVDLKNPDQLEKRLDFGTSNLEFTSDGEFMVFWDQGGAWPIRVSDWESIRDERVKAEAFHCCPIESVTFSPDNKFLISNDNHRFMVWDATSGQLLAELSSPRLGVDQFCMMQSAVWDQAHDVIYGSDGYDVLQWKVKDFAGKPGVTRLKGELAFGTLKSRKSSIGLIDITLDTSGDHILVSNQKSITYREFSKPGVSKDIPLQRVDILSGPRIFAILPQSQKIFAASGSTLSQLDLGGTAAPKTMPGEILALSAGTGIYVVTNTKDRDKIEVRKLENGEILRTIDLEDSRHSSFSLSEDGKIAAFVSESAEHHFLVKIIDLEPGKLIAELPIPTKVMSLKISSDNKVLAAGCFNRSVQLWDLGEVLQSKF